MAMNSDTIALISVVIGFIGMAWAVFWPVREQPGNRPVSSHWDIVYVDDDGIMQFTLIRVLRINPGTRRMTAWCATTGTERVFKMGKIVKAIDARNGARIDVAWLMDKPRAMRLQPSSGRAGAAGKGGETATVGADTSGWWSASRLGLH